MFCLRSWVPLLIFLTNASPIYVLLFLSATYALQRPCVYCSALLFVLIISLFDFGADWFEPRWSGSAATSETLTSFLSGNATLSDTLIETATLAVTAINGTGGSLASMAMTGVKKGITAQSTNDTLSGTATDWVRVFIEKRQYRIPCLDVRIGL